MSKLSEPIWEPGWYTWKREEGDIPVFVTGYLGLGSDGKHYMAIEDSVTGIPLNELVKKKRRKKC
jgi:hypothetical protein